MNFRVSTTQDIPHLKELWKLAFHDEDAYVDNFFQSYATPDKIYLAEEHGNIIGMTAWFASDFHRFHKSYRFAYLYAVATHPEEEKKGIASRLLTYVYESMVKLGFHGVTTVPARPDLHPFFKKNGFEEYFIHEKNHITCDSSRTSSQTSSQITDNLVSLSPKSYKNMVDLYFQSSPMPYISLDVEGCHYQHALCQLHGGGFFALKEETSSFSSHNLIFTLEPMGNDTFLIKEALSLVPFEDILPSALVQSTQKVTGKILSLPKTEYRYPPQNREKCSHSQGVTQNFAMIQWLNPPPSDWNPEQTGEKGYLGLAFD